ncbi:hypothetical protein ES706_06498 [subsurface metagenome]
MAPTYGSRAPASRALPIFCHGARFQAFFAMIRSISRSRVRSNPAPSASQNLIPLYSGGLWEAVMMMPASHEKWRMAKESTGVGVKPSLRASHPPAVSPATIACSNISLEVRLSYPTATFPSPLRCVAKANPSSNVSLGVSSRLTTPRTPKVPNSFGMISG